MRRILAAAAMIACAILLPTRLHGQEMSCSDSMMKGGKSCTMMEKMKDMMPPPPSGSAIFDAIGGEVRDLDADSSTDWSKVNLEELRQHLIDMNLVMMTATVAATNVDGGVKMTISGTGATVAAIQRMLVNHLNMLQQSGQYVTTVSKTKTGVVATVTAPAPATDKAVARIRGLGFAGLMTVGMHHMRHHGNMARGDSMPHAH